MDTYCISSAKVNNVHTGAVGYRAIKIRKVFQENMIIFQVLSALKIITHLQSCSKIV
jgi:hypothetical protein